MCVYNEFFFSNICLFLFFCFLFFLRLRNIRELSVNESRVVQDVEDLFSWYQVSVTVRYLRRQTDNH